MNILVLTFYYAPDLSAGSFRATALVRALLEVLPATYRIEVLTTRPNRYKSFQSDAPAVEETERLTVRRIELPIHQSGMVDQARAFVGYARAVRRLVRSRQYDLVYGTSSRLMTAALASYIASTKSARLYLDIRDIFLDTILDVLPAGRGALVRPLIALLEKYTFRNPARVNLVSRGFAEYFNRRYPRLKYSFFTNGIDPEFTSVEYGNRVRAVDGMECSKIPRWRILYAGNFGEGQGLDLIIPGLANRLGGNALLRLIGDGGKRDKLIHQVASQGCINVEVCPPVNRAELLVEYQEADVLFLHLNDHEAFKKVLPSKLFEYAATGKPILAGVSGYAAEFIRQELVNAEVFDPCDVDGGYRAFSRLSLKWVDRSVFVSKYSRRNIMRGMALDIRGIVGVP